MDSPTSGLLGIPQLGDHVPFSGKQYPLNMGLQPLNFPDDWMQFDQHYVAQMEQRQALLSLKPDEVFAHVPDGDAGSEETLSLLMEHLPRLHPHLFERVDHGVRNAMTGHVILHDSSEHALLRAARLVQEDLLVMHKHPDGEYRLAAGVLCFPSRWLLQEKMGRATQVIHGPVPFYKERIAGKVDDLMGRLKVSKPLWRLNWSVHDVDELFQPTRVFPADGKIVTAENAGTSTFMRFERQTLVRLPATDDVLFTIHTYVRELAKVLNTKVLGQHFLSAVEAMPQSAIAYKGMAEFFPAVVAYVQNLVNAAS